MKKLSKKIETKKGKKRKPFSEETKKKMSEASKGKIISDETKERIRKSLKEYYKNKNII